MDRRLGQLAGLGAFALALARLGRLLQSPPELARWDLILVAAGVLGALVWWLASQLFRTTRVRVGLFTLAGVLVFLRIAVPASLSYGILPGLDTQQLLGIEIDEAIRSIRFGVPPIVPSPGVVAVLALGVWVIGGLFAWGSRQRNVWALFVPSLAFYLQFAVLDRRDASSSWLFGSAGVFALGMAAAALAQRSEAGRARDGQGRVLPRRPVAAAMVTAAVIAGIGVASTGGASGLVSEYGNLSWRSGGSGYGTGGGGVEFNRLVDLRQRIIDRSNDVVFRATLGEGAPPPGEIYWRMETLDEFDGTAWRRANSVPRVYEPDRRIGSAADRYGGTTASVLQLVEIAGLRGEVAPTAGVPSEIHRIEGLSQAIEPTAFRILSDAAIIHSPGLRDGDTYQVLGDFGLDDDDVGALATGADGQLSPLFASAAEEGEFSADPAPPPGIAGGPAEHMTDLPEGLPADIYGLASSVTAGATTDYERAWMLQHWFRDSGEFQYSTSVSTGHGSLDLANWLTDPTSRNYRIGYCEQFSASMAVLGRALGIPSRVVWGFTPGETVAQGDGSEVVVVRDTNAHAWVEMWMEGFGWVRFDPTPRGEFQPRSITAAFDPAEHIPERDEAATLRGPLDPTLGVGEPLPFEDDAPVAPGSAEPAPWGRLAALLLVLISSVPAAKALRRSHRRRKARRGDVTAAWDEIVDRLIDLGEAPSGSATPIEVARASGNALLPLARGYSAAIYGDRTVTGVESDFARAEEWIASEFEGGRRALAAISPRSLVRRG